MKFLHSLNKIYISYANIVKYQYKVFTHMQTWSFTQKFDACLSTDLLNTIYKLYQHKKEDIEPALKSELGLNDISIVDTKSSCDSTNLYKLLKAYVLGKPNIDLQYITSTMIDSRTNEKTIIIIFKGSKEIEDWISNFSMKESNFFNSDLKVHLGFNKTIELFEDSFKKYCNQAKKDSPFFNLYTSPKESNIKIILAGHSLGGSLATLAACRYYDLGFPSENLAVYSFGAPPIGSIKFQENYHEKFNIYRFTNSLDVISRNALFFKIFRKKDLVHICDPIILPSNEGEVHSIHGYIDNLAEYIKKFEKGTT